MGAEGLNRREGCSQTKAGKSAFLSSQGCRCSRGLCGVCTGASTSVGKQNSSQRAKL